MLDKTVHILVVEDDDVEAEAVKRAFDRQKMSNEFTFVNNGFEALNALRGGSGQPPVPYPYLILLDINMPRMNGHEFLRELRLDPDLRSSVVFVFTTSDNNEDKAAAYQELVAGYLVKSKAGKDFSHLVDLISSYNHLADFPLRAT